MVRAARDAGIHDSVAGRVGGYASLVTEGGQNFSGGERQRVEIARAIVGDPSILILDEATSALDTEVEAEIMTRLLRRGCTLLLVSHRLSAIRHCDEILVIEAGRIVQRGTFAKLSAADGPFLRLLEA